MFGDQRMSKEAKAKTAKLKKRRYKNQYNKNKVKSCLQNCMLKSRKASQFNIHISNVVAKVFAFRD